MTIYSHTTESEPSVKELLELSTLYHTLINDLADLWNVDMTPSSRARAFQIVTDFAEQLKMKTLAAAVLSEINQKETENENT